MHMDFYKEFFVILGLLSGVAVFDVLCCWASKFLKKLSKLVCLNMKSR